MKNRLVGAGRRGITLGETDGLASAPSRPGLGQCVYWARRAGENAFRTARIITRLSRPYGIIGMATIEGSDLTTFHLKDMIAALRRSDVCSLRRTAAPAQPSQRLCHYVLRRSY